MLVLIIGPKGSGKSYIGRILEQDFVGYLEHGAATWRGSHSFKVRF
jgi:adenylate kinase family enzyme